MRINTSTLPLWITAALEDATTVVIVLIKPAIAPPRATQHATTAATKGTFPASVRLPKLRSPATDVVSLATFLATALPRAVAAAEEWVAARWAAGAWAVDRSAISVASLVTSPVTAPRAAVTAAARVALVVAATAVAMEVVAGSKTAIPVAASATCLATAPKDRSATTVEK